MSIFHSLCHVEKDFFRAYADCTYSGKFVHHAVHMICGFYELCLIS